MKSIRSLLAACVLGGAAFGALVSCDGQKQVVIYSNADDEAISSMSKALDKAGFKDQYIFTPFSTSELGGKVIAEGRNIEADMLTLSTYYLDSAEAKNHMFVTLPFERQPLKATSTSFAPITGQEGAIFLNTKVMKERNVTAPRSLKDLAKPEYKGLISLPNIKSSSTAWLMIQALVNAYGEEGAREVLKGMIDNAGPHLENSGSAPLKKLRAGEVAIAFGLRQQAVGDKKAGLPIDYVDPEEGSFSLVEAIAVPDKGDLTNPVALKMAEAIILEGRDELMKTYPVPLYVGEKADSETKSLNQKTFPEPLTVELLKKHQGLMPQ